MPLEPPEQPEADDTLPLDEDPPVDEVLDTVAPPVLVEDPPEPPDEDVLLTAPLEEVLEKLPLEVDDPPVDVEPPLVDELVEDPPLDVEPPDEVEEITMLPPPLLPPPPKNPPAKKPPPPKPPLPPITVVPPPPPPEPE